MTTITEAGLLNPFVGLRPFREEEQNLFFGRESLVDRMVDKLAAHRFLAVVGGSGSGKSSLVNCGLKPALRRGLLTSAGSSWRMVQFRPGTNPNQELANAMVKDGSIIPCIGGSTMGADLVEATLGLSGFGLVDIYKQSPLGPDTNLLVVVDQFEELFRYRSLSTGASYGYGPETIRFVRLLLDAASQNEVPIYVVVTMRSDFLGDCAQFDGLPEAISEGQYLVPRLTRAERRAAIEGPIHVVFSEISTALLTRLVNDVGDNPDQLSILQHAMNRTWAHWHHDRGAQGPINMDDYEAVGTMAKALDGHANKAYAELPHGRKQFLCQRAFKALTDRGTDPRGVRRPTKFANLCEIVGATPDELLEVLGPFRKASRSFLMPAEGDTPGSDTPIDISHESLMRVWVKLNVWTNEEAEAAREYRRVSDRAEGYGLKKSGLMQDPDLQTALDFEARQQPTAAWAELYGGKFQQATQFLRDSEEQNIMRKANRELDRRWQLRWRPIIFGVVAIAFLVVLFNLERKGGLLRAFKASAPELAQMSPLDALKKAPIKTLLSWLTDFGRYLRPVGGRALAFVLGYFGILYVGRILHRKLALPAIVEAIRNPPKPSPVVTQQVKDPAQVLGTTYARSWRRGLAFLLDCLVGLLLIGATSLSLALLAFKLKLGEDLIIIGLYLAWIPLWCLYHVITEASRRQASFGMWVVHIFAADLNGQRLSRWGALKRQLFKVVALGIVVVLATLVGYGVSSAIDALTEPTQDSYYMAPDGQKYKVMESTPSGKYYRDADGNWALVTLENAQLVDVDNYRVVHRDKVIRHIFNLPLLLALLLMTGLYFIARRRFRDKPLFQRRQSLFDLVVLATVITYGFAYFVVALAHLEYALVLDWLLLVLLLLVGLYLSGKLFPNKPIFRRRQWLNDYFSKTVVLVGRPGKPAAKAGTVPAKPDPAVTAAPALT